MYNISLICRIGSLENELREEEAMTVLICRIGSLEKTLYVR